MANFSKTCMCALFAAGLVWAEQGESAAQKTTRRVLQFRLLKAASAKKSAAVSLGGAKVSRAKRGTKIIPLKVKRKTRYQLLKESHTQVFNIPMGLKNLETIALITQQKATESHGNTEDTQALVGAAHTKINDVSEALGDAQDALENTKTTIENAYALINSAKSSVESGFSSLSSTVGSVQGSLSGLSTMVNATVSTTSNIQSRVESGFSSLSSAIGSVQGGFGGLNASINTASLAAANTRTAVRTLTDNIDAEEAKEAAYKEMKKALKLKKTKNAHIENGVMTLLPSRTTLDTDKARRSQIDVEFVRGGIPLAPVITVKGMRDAQFKPVPTFDSSGLPDNLGMRTRMDAAAPFIINAVSKYSDSVNNQITFGDTASTARYEALKTYLVNTLNAPADLVTVLDDFQNECLSGAGDYTGSYRLQLATEMQGLPWASHATNPLGITLDTWANSTYGLATGVYLAVDATASSDVKVDIYSDPTIGVKLGSSSATQLGDMPEFSVTTSIVSGRYVMGDPIAITIPSNYRSNLDKTPTLNYDFWSLAIRKGTGLGKLVALTHHYILTYDLSDQIDEVLAVLRKGESYKDYDAAIGKFKNAYRGYSKMTNELESIIKGTF